ncbi:hypothetical protein BH160DRAFT_3236 [Burkholderia sp. H160]|nr:hypothetical protein BH160DRAFT_3236 [Burkholderia sp. H160]
MKKQVTQLMIAMMGLSVAPMVFAQTAPGTGKVTFNGKLTDDTCVIKAGDEDQTVTLPTVSAKTLPTAGTAYGSTPFTISRGRPASARRKPRSHWPRRSMAASRT